MSREEHLEKEIDKLEYQNSYREEQARQEKESSKVFIGACIVLGVLPMMSGIFVGNRETATGGAIVLLLLIAGRIWWNVKYK